MLYSRLFGKTSKTASEEANISSKLLQQGGYIRESTAGRFFFLPMGWRVMQKITAIIRKQMNSIGSQEMITPTLHPLELWKETNRTNTAGFELMKVKDRHGSEFALGGTAEEMFVDLVRKFNISYRDCPFHLYQFSTKFRDELRARGGLLRVREFIMKDAYSFDTDKNSFTAMYQTYKDTYTAIFNELGLDTIVVESDNGYIGGEYCHEFVALSEAGESLFLMTEDASYAAHVDVAKFKRDPANANEQLKPLEIIKQPQWVKTMDDNQKHYNLPVNHFLKNVVYKNTNSGQIVIAVTTGDLEVNKTKLEHAVNAVGQLEDATDEDLKAIGTKYGYVHSWGHKNVVYVGDLVLTNARNLIGGQKEDETDSINVNYGRDFKCDIIADIATAKAGYQTDDGKVLIEKKGIEVGNIFQLGLHYSSLMEGASYTDAQGAKVPYYMGCYGIGLGRTLATIVDRHHDEKGIIWPASVAPYSIHLVGLDLKDEQVQTRAKQIYETLQNHYPNEVLFDDRIEARSGEKFADADLLGSPIRIVVSKRTGDKIEIKKRNEKESQLITLEEFIKT